MSEELFDPQPGDEVCACDLKHYTVAYIWCSTEDERFAITTDGKSFAINYCLEPVLADGTCHSGYYNLDGRDG
jgi:hypothetical protein